MRSVAAIAMLAACGGAPEQPVAQTRAASPIATSAGSGDVIVATVNGRPVWGSCVAAQKTVDDCIAFELLAQEAEKRGLAEDADVVDATRAALVNRAVELFFERRYMKPTDLGPRLDKWIADNNWRTQRPELRSSAYLRVVAPANAPADAERAVAEALYAKLKSERGMFGVNMKELTTDVPVNGTTVEYAAVGDKAKNQLDAGYANTLFAIAEVGTVAPPVRTPWGWDIVLYTGGLPPNDKTIQQMAQDAFPELKRSLFPIWLSQLARELGVKPEIDQQALAKLDEVGP